MTVPRKLAALEYTALRLPLTTAHKVVTRLDESSPLRLGFEKGLGSLDATVGKVLANPDLTRRGSELSRRAQVLEKATVLEEKAAARKAEADTELKTTLEAAERKRVESAQQAQKEARQLREQQQKQKKAVAQKAEAQARARTEAVEREAAQKLSAVERSTEQTVTSIEKRTQARTAAPKAQLRDAATVMDDATHTRGQADRMADLAQAERAARQSG